jgi:hypothetical protein
MPLLQHDSWLLNFAAYIQKMIAEANNNGRLSEAQLATLSEPQLNAYRDYLLLEWQEAKRLLTVAQEAEMDLRKQVVNFASDPNKLKGTERIELGNGYEMKLVKKLNFGFVKKDDGKVNKAAIDAALDRIERTGPVGAYLAGELVKWTPDLSLTEYNKLDKDDEIRKIIDEVIVTTPGAPTLEIIPPKVKP